MQMFSSLPVFSVQLISNLFVLAAGITILKNLNFQFFAGERIKVEGENRTGKTTFVKMISGLLKPSNGGIKINGESFNDYASDFFKTKILYVSQDEVILKYSE